MQGLVGPSIRVEVAAAVLDEDAIDQPPQPAEGRTLPVLLVDFTSDIVPFLKVVQKKEDVENAHFFDIFEPLLLPVGDELIAKALAWADTSGPGHWSAFYSAEDVPVTPPGPSAKRAARRKVSGGGIGDEGASNAASKTRPTVTQLAEPLDILTQSLPATSAQLRDLTLRTEAMERSASHQTSRPSALRVPLGAPSGFAKASNSGAADATAQTYVCGAGNTTGLIQSGGGSGGAGGKFDGGAIRSDLRGSSSLSSSWVEHGSKSELAAHKGVFFTSVLQSMSRRMYPAQASDVEMSAL